MNYEFVPYNPVDLPEVEKIFRSNVPKYFFDFEEAQLKEQLANRIFDYCLLKVGGIYVGAGGYAQNLDTTVSLCWGMVHADFHGMNYGSLLLELRLERIREQWPGLTVVNVTSQHTTGFFEKFGFEIVSVKENGFGPGLHECKMKLKQ